MGVGLRLNLKSVCLNKLERGKREPTDDFFFIIKTLCFRSCMKFYYVPILVQIKLQLCRLLRALPEALYFCSWNEVAFAPRS